MPSIRAEYGENIDQAVAYLNEGRVVAVPTGTFYGLAADVTQGYALQRVRNLKQRPADKSFTVFMRDDLWPEYFAMSALEERVLENSRNKPLTLLLKPRPTLSYLAQDGWLGLRVIDHPLMQKIAEAYDRPMTATSANVSGDEPCLGVGDILRQFPGQIDEDTYDLSLAYILDGGELPKSLPTTIARLDNEKLTIVRPGALSTEELEAILGRCKKNLTA